MIPPGFPLPYQVRDKLRGNDNPIELAFLNYDESETLIRYLLQAFCIQLHPVIAGDYIDAVFFSQGGEFPPGFLRIIVKPAAEVDEQDMSCIVLKKPY